MQLLRYIHHKIVNQDTLSFIYSMHQEQSRKDYRIYNLDESLLWNLHEQMEQSNPFCSRFKMMKQIEEEENIRARERNMTPRHVFMHTKSDRTADLRRFNPATANEIAAIFTSDGTPPSTMRHEIIIYPRPAQNAEELQAMEKNGLYYIQRMNPNCDPMIYPLLFPFGEQGWRQNIPHQVESRSRTTATPMEFYSFKLQIRDHVFPTLQSACKLFHQYIVDACTKIEGYRLDWLRNNQSNLRIELYQGLMDYINGVNSADSHIGRRFILPSTFIGSPRAMQQNFQDAMAIVRELGKPDLFITITCNPSWPEITSSLLPQQIPADRPDAGFST